jgi:hypothetical protein
MSMVINTTKVTGRRTLRFESLDAIGADIEALASAKEVKALGNWTPGQVLKHLAVVMNCAIDGMPTRPPWHVRVFLFVVRPVFVPRILNKGMDAGFQLPADLAAHIVPPASTTWEDGLAAIRAAIRRLKAETKREPSPFMGNLSLDDYNRLQCRHSELHLSFLVPSV